MTHMIILEVFVLHGAVSEYQVKKKDGEEYKPAAKSALKKATNYAAQQKKELEATGKRPEKETQEEARRAAKEEAGEHHEVSGEVGEHGNVSLTVQNVSLTIPNIEP
ncbi:hypothetical protein CEP54_016330 [Fusarium duplospermum]|uniref:Asparagine--tRNA ligase N-terminal domain-containing protein n=1 Tax=Fusarium duplospermum TaxID=1325734 RepID=A0A428NF46_9HYPO|nr:hypothetical protein CEP54_016330 [Fusarium duplospermum]